jgi:hypothetical protein
MSTDPATRSILWRRLDVPGHDAAWLSRAGANAGTGAGWRIAGSAAFAREDDHRPCGLAYVVTCDDTWTTRGARISGWSGDEAVDISIQVTPDRRWFMNGKEIVLVAGCVDLDLAFTPATNALAIRRLKLAVGGARVALTSAWLTFPALALEPLPQAYRRMSDRRYEYEAPTQDFSTELVVNDAGFVIEYPTLWTAEPTG